MSASNRTLAAIVLGLSLESASCGGDGTHPLSPETTPPEAIGTLTVSVVGFVTMVPTGVALAILRTDMSGQSGRIVVVPSVASLTIELPAGSYRISYTPPADYSGNLPVSLPVIVKAGVSGSIAFTDRPGRTFTGESP